MNLSHLNAFNCLARHSARILLALFALLLGLSISSIASALDTQVYSFENDLEGWTDNPGNFNTTGPDVVVTQDTFGATSGTHSMKVELSADCTFCGALTINLPPTILTPPTSPGIDHLHFDVTLTDQFAGNFSDIGVTVFGESNVGNGSGQMQFSGFAFTEGRPAGTYRDLRVDLSHLALSSLGLPDGKFSDVLGTGPNQMNPTSFQLYFNKPSGFAQTLYIDNIRLGAKVPGDYNLNDVVDAADYTLWRDTLGGTGASRAANGDNTGTSTNVIDIADFNYWKTRFGNVSGAGGGGLGGVGVPEPGTAVLALIAAIGGLVAFRKSKVAGI